MIVWSAYEQKGHVGIGQLMCKKQQFCRIKAEAYFSFLSLGKRTLRKESRASYVVILEGSSEVK